MDMIAMILIMIIWEKFIQDHIANSISLKDKMVEINTTYNIGITPSINNPGILQAINASFWNYNFGAILLIEEYYGVILMHITILLMT